VQHLVAGEGHALAVARERAPREARAMASKRGGLVAQGAVRAADGAQLALALEIASLAGPGDEAGLARGLATDAAGLLSEELLVERELGGSGREQVIGVDGAGSGGRGEVAEGGEDARRLELTLGVNVDVHRGRVVAREAWAVVIAQPAVLEVGVEHGHAAREIERAVGAERARHQAAAAERAAALALGRALVPGQIDPRASRPRAEQAEAVDGRHEGEAGRVGLGVDRSAERGPAQAQLDGAARRARRSGVRGSLLFGSEIFAGFAGVFLVALGGARARRRGLLRGSSARRRGLGRRGLRRRGLGRRGARGLRGRRRGAGELEQGQAIAELDDGARRDLGASARFRACLVVLVRGDAERAAVGAEQGEALARAVEGAEDMLVGQLDQRAEPTGLAVEAAEAREVFAGVLREHEDRGRAGDGLEREIQRDLWGIEQGEAGARAVGRRCSRVRERRGFRRARCLAAGRCVGGGSTARGEGEQRQRGEPGAAARTCCALDARGLDARVFGGGSGGRRSAHRSVCRVPRGGARELGGGARILARNTERPRPG
jgi:hypothetical protein